MFFSEVGTVGGGVAVGNPVVTLAPGASDTLYLWSSADQNCDTSIGMNVRSATAGVIAFTGSVVENPEILSMALGGAPAGVDRWQDVDNGVVTADAVTAMNAVKVNEGTGITSANNGTVGLFKYLDPMYDVAAGAFLLGSVSFDAMAEGSTTVSIDQTATALFVNAGSQVFPEFGTATINSELLLVLGDMNLDGEVNGLDIDLFVHAVVFEPFHLLGDMNEDGIVTGLDVAPFVAAVIAGGTQAVPEPSTLILATFAFLVLAWRRPTRR